ncbi:MAG: hypothetical protein GY820_30990 [Gammaproteobacteria bacterium]|nr:hypothetical protein [Gammaproteobacteria bacterium]
MAPEREQCGGTVPCSGYLSHGGGWGRALVNYSPHQPGGSGVEPATFELQV